MKIKLLQKFMYDYRHYNPGDVIETVDTHGTLLINAKVAEPYVETAVAGMSTASTPALVNRRERRKYKRRDLKVKPTLVGNEPTGVILDDPSSYSRTDMQADPS